MGNTAKQPRRNAPWIASLAVTSPLLLSACGGANSSGLSFIASPTLDDYSARVMDMAAGEMEQLGPPCARDFVYPGCSALVRLAIDYGDLRQRLRAAGE